MNLKRENLFLIDHINEEERFYERQMKASAAVIKAKQDDIQ